MAPVSFTADRFNFLREAQIWYDRDSLQDRSGEHFENVIV